MTLDEVNKLIIQHIPYLKILKSTDNRGKNKITYYDGPFKNCDGVSLYCTVCIGQNRMTNSV
jgi:hypothetical protein